MLFFEIDVSGLWVNEPSEKRFSGELYVKDWKRISEKDFIKATESLESNGANPTVTYFKKLKENVNVKSSVDGEGFGNVWSDEVAFEGFVYVSLDESALEKPNAGLLFEYRFEFFNGEFDGSSGGYLIPGTTVESLYEGHSTNLSVILCDESLSERGQFADFVSIDELMS